MHKATIWELLAKKLSGDATEQDLADLEEQLKADPSIHYPVQTLTDIWEQPLPNNYNSAAAFEEHLLRLQPELDMAAASLANGNQQPRRRSYLFMAASAGLLILAISWWIVGRQAEHPAIPAVARQDKSEVSTKYGSRTRLLLPDGTQVWLNAGSRLSYDKTYGNDLREVVLSGEGYFDVVRNPAHPFVIHTGTINIKVLGTVFNVKAFPGEKNTETSLLRGSIEVSFTHHANEKIILKPNQKLITSNEVASDETAQKDDTAGGARAASIPAPPPLVKLSSLTYETHDSTVLETSWMNNKLIFQSQPFEDLARQMERWYAIRIRFADERIKPKKLTGTFEHENIQQALQALQLITPFNFKLTKDEVVISSK